MWPSINDIARVLNEDVGEPVGQIMEERQLLLVGDRLMQFKPSKRRVSTQPHEQHVKRRVRELQHSGYEAFEVPPFHTIQRMVEEGNATTPDGCQVGISETCPHGYHSWPWILEHGGNK